MEVQTLSFLEIRALMNQLGENLTVMMTWSQYGAWTQSMLLARQAILPFKVYVCVWGVGLHLSMLSICHVTEMHAHPPSFSSIRSMLNEKDITCIICSKVHLFSVHAFLWKWQQPPIWCMHFYGNFLASLKASRRSQFLECCWFVLFIMKCGTVLISSHFLKKAEA